jgi:putative ABC transport system substrate-binding protein
MLLSRHTRRREFITLLGGAAAAWPLAARAQQPAMPVIGFLGLGSPRPMGRLVAAFRQGLAKAGYVEGQNVAIEFRWADFSQSARLPALAAELVHRQVAVIFAGGFGGPAFAAKAATSTIPIVFAYGGDPVKGGLVASLSHPGGNVTGVTAINAELVSKWLSLAGDLVPQATTVGFLSGDSSYLAFYEDQKSQILAAARALGRQVIILETRSDLDYEAAFKTLVQREAGALIVGPFAFRNTNEILALAARYKIPTIYPRRSYVEAGGLMSYAADYADTFRQAGVYTGRILAGAKPADLPVMLATKFELVINLKTAKALGLEISPTLLATAHEVIE